MQVTLLPNYSLQLPYRGNPLGDWFAGQDRDLIGRSGGGCGGRDRSGYNHNSLN